MHQIPVCIGRRYRRGGQQQVPFLNILATRGLRRQTQILRTELHLFIVVIMRQVINGQFHNASR